MNFILTLRSIAGNDFDEQQQQQQNNNYVDKDNSSKHMDHAKLKITKAHTHTHTHKFAQRRKDGIKRVIWVHLRLPKRVV